MNYKYRFPAIVFFSFFLLFSTTSLIFMTKLEKATRSAFTKIHGAPNPVPSPLHFPLFILGLDHDCTSNFPYTFPNPIQIS